MPSKPSWEEISWNDIVPRLTLFTVRLMKKRGMGDMTASAPDVAQAAILKVLSGQRVWKQESEIDLFRFLTGVVSSDLSHLYKHNQKFPSVELDEISGGEAEDDSLDALHKIELEKFIVYAGKRDREAQALAILSTKLGVVDRTEQELILGLEEGQVYNVKKRLNRIIQSYHADREKK